MPILLSQLISDFADALVEADACYPVHKQFRPGIGPFGENEAIRKAVDILKDKQINQYGKTVIKRLPDILIPEEWAIECKLIRPFGDNGKPAEHWSENILHPYIGNTSSIGDCIKLIESGLAERKAIIIIGYEHTPPIIELGVAVRSFEVIASKVMLLNLTSRVEEVRTGLVHPVHQQLRVYGYEILS